MACDRGMNFEKWKEEVDRKLIKLCGLDSGCLPDVDYWGLYQTGDTPIEAAKYALEEAL
jgi:hypothetical protein